MIRPDMAMMNMSVMKWDPSFDYAHSIRVYKNSIVACAEPNEMMMKNYTEILEQKDRKKLQMKLLKRMMQCRNSLEGQNLILCIERQHRNYNNMSRVCQRNKRILWEQITM